MFETLDTFDTTFSADSVEWCPAEGLEDVFVCGTYQLSAEENEGLSTSNETEQKRRIGSIYLFQIIKDKTLRLKLVQQLDTEAVLDMKWAPIKCLDGKVLLGVVNSVGFLQIYELIEEENNLFLKFVSDKLVNDTENPTIALSLDWSAGNRDNSHNSDVKITVSDSRGSISLFRLSKNAIEKIVLWHAHEYEAWITTFDYWNTNVVYTGGDDCKFLRFDTRINTVYPTNTNRSHNAGVTSLRCNWKKEFCLVSGSYDESLRTWDLRNIRRPIAETNLHGGIWRLKWDPFESKYLLAACMYNGFFLIDCDDSNAPKVVSEYKEHESIAYGCDWSYLNGRCSNNARRKFSDDEENVTLVATCSFYDHVLKLSSVKLEK